jgi:hypothetical protein
MIQRGMLLIRFRIRLEMSKGRGWSEGYNTRFKSSIKM